jgi:septation ring formation regulator EzrA
MNSFQESKNELEAAIRYAENAISSAQGTIESMEFRQEMAKKQYAEQTGREEALTKKVQKLEYELTAKTAQAGAWKKEVDKLREDNADLRLQIEGHRTNMALMTDELEKPTMPVIPKDVAIAIFREGVQSGVNDAVAELEGQTINICENEYCGDFEVTFARDIDLDDELDLDWMRGKVGQYEESFVVDALKGLCADKEFECRIHGIDDNE